VAGRSTESLDVMRAGIAAAIGVVASVANGYACMIASFKARSDPLILASLVSIFVVPILLAAASWLAIWPTWRAHRSHWGWLIFVAIPTAIALSFVSAVVTFLFTPGVWLTGH
jgi:hypothetical protein